MVLGEESLHRNYKMAKALIIPVITNEWSKK
jgi:hypothetical protein